MKSKLSLLTILVVYVILSSQTGCESSETLKAAQPAEKLQVTEKSAKTSKNKEKVAEITFESTIHDFGDVLGKSKNAGEFKFENTGNAVLKIGKIKRTCGCTVFELAKKEYEPGEKGVIKVQYSASNRPGSAMKHLYVPSNAKNNPKVELTIKANITLKVKAAPQIITLTLGKENAGCQPITLASTDGVPFKIISFSSSNDTITAEFDPSAEGTEFVLHPKVNIDKLSKRLNGHINIRLTHPQCDTVSVTYTTPAQFQTNPAAIIIQKADPTEKIKKQIVVKSNYGKPFEIESVSSEKGSMKLLSQKKLDEGVELEIQIEPPSQAKKIRFFTDWLYIQIKNGERLQVHANMWFARSKG
jgi:hypothetical protein